MNFIPFDEQNIVLGEGQPEYIPLPAYKCDNPEGECIYKVQMTPEELQAVIDNGGSFYVSQYTFGQMFQPISFGVASPFRTFYNIVSVTAEDLFNILQEGSAIGNHQISRDVPVFQIVKVEGEEVVFKFINPKNRDVISSERKSLKEFSEHLMNTRHPDQWFIINPKL